MAEPDLAAERAVIESLIDDQQYEAVWHRLPTNIWFAACRAVNARALGVLAAVWLQQLDRAQAASGVAVVPAWVSRAIDAARSTELNADVLMQAWLAEQHDRGVQLSMAHPDPADPMAIGARRAMLGSELMMGELDEDWMRVRRLVKDADDAIEVREALAQLADALVRDLAEVTGGSRERVLGALGTP